MTADTFGVDFHTYKWETLYMNAGAGNPMSLLFAGPIGQTFLVSESTDMVTWSVKATNTITSSNLLHFFHMTSTNLGFIRAEVTP